MRLLIVDDGLFVVQYLEHLLDWEKFGIAQVSTTTNSIMAKHILEQNTIDILITDIRMPEVTGLDLLGYINEHGLRTKVIFLSGYSEFEYAHKALRMGAIDYLLKPVDMADMEKAMSQVVKSLGEDGFKARHDRRKSEGASGLAAAEEAGPEADIAGRPAEAAGPCSLSSGPDIVAAVQKYINGHLDGGLSLEELGKLVHLHPVYLSKLYKQETGENLSSFISFKRLERAARLLTDSSLHVIDISRLVGYKKPQYFIKLFRDRYGLTPYQYRRSHMK